MAEHDDGHTHDGLVAEIEAAVASLEASRGKSFVERFKALGLDPLTDFAGGDWRNCDFSKSDLSGCDFRNTRLYRANFKHALVNGADFRGASDIHTTQIHLSYGWKDAEFHDYQIILIEAQIARMRAYHDDKQSLVRDTMDEKEWFYLIKACPTFAEAAQMLEQMEAAGYRLSPFAYSYVLDRAKRDYRRREGWALYQRFLSEGGEVDEVLTTAAMGVSPDSSTALDMFNAMKKDMAGTGQLPGERAYNMAISEQDDNFTVALALFHDMKRNSVSISRYTIFSLFDACQDFAHAVTVLMEAGSCGIEIDDAEFLKELNNTTRYRDLNDWNVEYWLDQGHSYKEVIRRLIWSILGDPFRSNALASLGFPATAPPK